MEENNIVPEQQVPKVKTAKKTGILPLLLGVAVVVLLLGCGYLWQQLKTANDTKAALQKDKQSLQSKIDNLSKKPAASQHATSPSPVACNSAPSAGMKENIKAALDSKNTAAFSTYTTNPVNFVIAASEKGGNETPDQAAVDMAYTHTATGPWDFNLPPATIASYDAGFYTDYFSTNSYVGKAASGMVASFNFDCAGKKIKQIFLAADASLLL